MVVSTLENYCINGGWFRALSTVDGKVPSHTAGLTPGNSHVSVPRNTQPRFISKFVQTTRCNEAIVPTMVQILKDTLVPGCLLYTSDAADE